MAFLRDHYMQVSEAATKQDDQQDCNSDYFTNHVFSASRCENLTSLLVKTYERKTLQSRAEAWMWHLIDSKLGCFQNLHQRFWWEHGGYVLAILLYKAGYSDNLQRQNLQFFATTIAPNLGPAPYTATGDMIPLSSFMTDDGTPIELSWDWGNANKPPRIRYSIEPMGLDIGDTLVASNRHAALSFHEKITCLLPGIKTKWFRHFEEYFECGDLPDSKSGDDSEEGHASQIFYAFDLDDTDITGKAYFFPGRKARSTGLSKLNVVLNAVETAPFCNQENLRAFWSFFKYASEPSARGVAIEMLAIDLVEPFESRIKVYFRSRETSLQSVIDIMTLGGRIRTNEYERGIGELSHFWKCLFNTQTSLDQHLPLLEHRTAGLLYNIEFKLLDDLPNSKIYIPVRHYANSDANTIKSLSSHLRYHKKDRYVKDYIGAMNCLFSQTTMQSVNVQTYIGCTICKDGSLRFVSYINPRLSERP